MVNVKEQDDVSIQLSGLKKELALLKRKLARNEMELSVAKARIIELEDTKAFYIIRLFHALNFIRSQFRFLLSRAYAVYKLGGIRAVFVKSKTIFGLLTKRVARNDSTNVAAESVSTDSSLQLQDSIEVKVEQGSQIVMYVDNFYDGGLERVVIDLILHLKKKGFVVWLLIAGKGGRAAEEAQNLGIRIESCDLSIKKIKSLLMESKPDLILMHHCYFHLKQIASLSIPIVEVLHNSYFWDIKNTRIQALRKQFISKYVAVSNSVADYSVNYLELDKNKVVTIANGLNPTGLIRPPLEYRRKARADFANEFRIVLPASFGPQKRHYLMVAAYAKLLKEDAKVKLIFVGSSDINNTVYKNTIEYAKSLGCHDNIAFSGVLNRFEMSKLLSTAHLAVLPSSVEGFSIASLEFAYFGLPCVLSNCGAAQEFIGEYQHGLVVNHAAILPSELNSLSISKASHAAPDVAVDELVNAIKAIKSDYANWLSRAENASLRWAEYSIEHTVSEYVTLFENEFGLIRNEQ